MQLKIKQKNYCLRGFKFMTTLILVFKRIKTEDKTKYDTFYRNLKTEIIINESDIDDVTLINLYYNYIKHAKIFRKRFRLDY